VSFESRKPVVYVHDVASGKRRLIANFRGSNSAPAWSPDGRTLAVTLSRDGGSQLYTIDANGGEPRRLTQSAGIDTEPLYSPTGAASTSSATAAARRRSTACPPAAAARARHLYGSYNISPASARTAGGWPTFRAVNGAFKLQVMELAGGNVQLITDTTADESPSFAPNGRLIVYATRQGGRKR
jgi:TolB protein